MFKDLGVHMKGGVITERDTQYCTVRIRLPAGIFSVEQMRGIATIAKRYGKGFVHCTARQTVEIPHVDPKKLRALQKALVKNGTPIGSERDEIVNVIACPGTERCKFANIDTASLAKKIDQKLFGKVMPVKMRIAVSGCPNACTSPMLNEIGIMGRVRPLRIEGQCTGCGTCVEYCKEDAIIIRNGLSELDENKCVQCGVCVQSCPFDLLKAEDRHFLILVGGRRGRHPHLGKELITVPDEETVVRVVDKIVDWVYRRAWSGRLLSEQMNDLQFETFREDIKKEISATTAKM
ncbi:MAG: 4Fe-4S binding protein [Methanoregula sp.]|jgi:dissimilatory sulfite reductase (desulfoviridin) alpha/beta subunit